MALLPNAGSFHLAVGAALIFGAFALMFLDLSINISMQPFKMLVSDMVNERQKGLAYSIQSFLCNAGSVVGFTHRPEHFGSLDEQVYETALFVVITLSYAMVFGIFFGRHLFYLTERVYDTSIV